MELLNLGSFRISERLIIIFKGLPMVHAIRLIHRMILQLSFHYV